MKKKFTLFILFCFIFSFGKAQEKVRIMIDATKTVGKIEPFWASQIIHPTEFLLTSWGKDFVRLMSETGAARQYIRIYNQPEKAIRVDANGKITYDWSHFDEMAEIILSTGNHLKVVFFGMPIEIAAFPESVKKRPYGGLVCISPPKDYKVWEELCANFARHVIKRYGLNEVKQWTIRCWNEPDLSGFWHKADMNEYLKLYDYFAKGIKSVSKEVKIGGPALSSTNTWNKPSNFTFFLDHIVKGVNHTTGETGSPIDFISIHTYGGSGAGAGPGRQFPEVNYLIEQQIRCADMRDQYPALKNIPIHVEEWGEASGGTTGVSSKPTADIRNSQYGAAFLTAWVERHLRIRQENDRKIEGFTFCSSGYEKIAEHDFMGYRTLHTRNGFYKPILNGYQILNRLAPDLVHTSIRSNDHIVSFASRDKNRIAIVITNYQYESPFNDGLCYPVSLNVNLPWKSASNATVKHWRIDKDHSNAYTAFKDAGSPGLPNPMEIDVIKNKMDLELLEQPKNVKTEKLLNLEFDMPCNSVSLIEIIKN